MAYYRLYFLEGPKGRIHEFREFEAEGDLMALAQAAVWRSVTTMELWCGGRRVRRWEGIASLHPAALQIGGGSRDLEIALDGTVPSPSPSVRTLSGVAAILLLIVLWAAFVATLAQTAGRWPVLVQAAYYLFMGIVWIIPLKPLVRWMQTGRFKAPRSDGS